MAKISKISIGMPVFNNEQFIRQSLDSLLLQTFSNFEIIISDNASTDSTSIICKEYAKKDDRIKYIRQEKNMGPTWNFIFVLEQAKYNYFMWAAGDDKWESTFIEKNIQAIESNDNIVASISDYDFFGKNIPDMYKSNSNGTIWRYLIDHQPSFDLPYSEKVSFYLRYDAGMHIYSIFLTDLLRKSIVYQHHVEWDQTIVLRILKSGDLHIVDEILMHRSVSGVSSVSSVIKRWLNQNVPIHWIIFMNIPFTYWCAKSFGKKIFLKNLGWFIKKIYCGEKSIIIDAVLLMLRIKK
jgi:glycosyltransferase involved in cell wall biosynthesis